MHSAGCLRCQLKPFGKQRTKAVATLSPSAGAAQEASPSRRNVLYTAGAVLTALIARQQGAHAAALPPSQTAKAICDAECLSKLEGIQEVKTASGLKYKDIVVGKGPNPPIGYQVVADYVAMTPDGRVFDSSLDKGRPYDLRIGSGQIVAGLDEGVAGMKTGGIRRIFVPGNLSFPKGLPSAPGRPRVPPSSPIMFDVHLLFIPGLDDEE